MNKMKIVPIVCLLLFAPVAGFALFDINLYGGIPFAGQYDDCNQKVFAQNSVWGTSAHVNTDVLAGLFQLGIGGFYQNSIATYKDPGAGTFGDDFTLKRKMLGIDGYVQLEIPLIPLSPYARVYTAAWNNVKGDNLSNTDNFKRHGVGAGFLVTLLPIPELFRLQLLTECSYEFGKEDGLKFRQYYLTLGLRADIL